MASFLGTYNYIREVNDANKKCSGVLFPKNLRRNVA